MSPQGSRWGNGDGRLLYPPRRTKPDQPVIEPPVSSIRFENIRDGIEDREYLLKLRRIAAARGHQGRIARALLATAHRELAPDLTCFEQNPVIFWITRHTIAEMIENIGAK